jgi:hypothetical protein
MIQRAILSAALGLTLIAGAAQARVWDFSFTGTSDSGSGQFTTSGASSPFTIIGITGVADGSAITALIAPNGYSSNDNLLTFPGPYLDVPGVSFVAGGIDYNLYYDGSEYLIGNSIAQGTVNDGAGDPVSLSVSVPEPATWAFMIAGLFGAGAFLRRRRGAAFA